MYRQQKNNPFAAIPVLGALAALKDKSIRQLLVITLALAGLLAYGFFQYGANPLTEVIKHERLLLNATRVYRENQWLLIAICAAGTLLRLFSTGVKTSLNDTRFKWTAIVVYLLALAMAAIHSLYIWQRTGDDLFLGLFNFVLVFWGLTKPVATGVLFIWYFFLYALRAKLGTEPTAAEPDNKPDDDKQHSPSPEAARLISAAIFVGVLIWAVYFFATGDKSARGLTGIYSLISIAALVIVYAASSTTRVDSYTTKDAVGRRVNVEVYRHLTDAEKQRIQDTIKVPYWLYACNIAALATAAMFVFKLDFDSYLYGFLVCAATLCLITVVIAKIAETAAVESLEKRTGWASCLLPQLYLAPAVAVIWGLCNLLFNL